MPKPAPFQARFQLDIQGHLGPVQQLAVSPDGKLLLSADAQELRVWDLATRQPLHRWFAPWMGMEPGLLLRFALSPDGRWVVVVTLNRWRDTLGDAAPAFTELQVYELATGNLQAASTWPGLAQDLAFSADGRQLLLASDPGAGECTQLQLLSLRALLQARFRPWPAPLAGLQGRGGEGLRLALRSVPGGGWLLAAQARRSPGALVWLASDRKAGLQVQRQIHTPVALQVRTLACSARHAVVAGYGSPRRDGRLGQLLSYRHDGQALPRTLTESLPAALAFDAMGTRLLVGLQVDVAQPPEDGVAPVGADMPPARPGSAAYFNGPPMPEEEGLGLQSVQVNAYAVAGDALTLCSSYFGHDDSVRAVAWAGAGLALSSGGDNQALHAWSTECRFPVRRWALRGSGRNCFAPGIDADEQLRFGVLPPRLLPPQHPERQQCFDLRSRTLSTTRASDIDPDDYASEKWLVAGELSPVIQLGHLDDAMAALDALAEKAVDAATFPADLSLYVGADDEWLLWSRSGFYDASPRGAQRAGYCIDRGREQEALFLPADRFKAFYRPDLIAAIVRHGSEERARRAGVAIPQLALAQMLPPLLELSRDGLAVDGGRVTLRFSVQQLGAGAPLERVWVVANERFAWELRRTDATWPRRRGRQGERRFQVSLPLRPGRNVFKLCAETADAKAVPLRGRGDGPALASTPAAAPALPPPGRLHLLCVGVSQMAVAGTPQAQGFKNLRYAHRDAIAVFKALARGRRQATGALHNPAFSAVQGELLTDAAATRAAVLAALERLCAPLRASAGAQADAPRDVLMVFLAGHGARFAGEQDLYFFTHDVEPATMDRSGLSLLELGRLVTSVAAEVVLVIDTCHAALAGDDVIASLSPEELGQRLHALNERGLTLLSAARGDEIARENPLTRQGLFTGALLQTLADTRFYAPGPPGQRALTLLGLMHGIETLVPLASAQAGTKPQTPVCRSYGDLLPLTLYRR
ncbi:caspase family protein [Inhella sp.]|uniref:caspase family protein n=1 Tax=Inhella sp. TaxID=1921806 RepID=UPI0035B1E56B